MQCGFSAADQFACVTHNIKSFSNQHAKTESIYKSLILSTGGVPTPETHSPVSRCCASLASQVAAQYQKYVFSELKLWINKIHANTWSTLHWPHVCSTHIMGLHNFLFMTMRTKLKVVAPAASLTALGPAGLRSPSRHANVKHTTRRPPRSTDHIRGIRAWQSTWIHRATSIMGDATRRTNLTGCRQII